MRAVQLSRRVCASGLRASASSLRQRVDCRTPSDVPLALHHLKVDRGVSWDEANRILAEAGGDQDAAARPDHVEESADGMTVWRLSNRQKMFGERDGLYATGMNGPYGRVIIAVEKGDASVRGLSEASNLFRVCACRVVVARARRTRATHARDSRAGPRTPSPHLSLIHI